MQAFKKVDMESWPRREHYRYYTEALKVEFNMTAPVDAKLSYSDEEGFALQRSVEGNEIDSVVFAQALAEALEKRKTQQNANLPVLIEVNIAKEPQKSGVYVEELRPLLKEIAQMERLAVQGLMTVMPAADDPETIRPLFREMRALFERIRDWQIPRVQMNVLSMGMSHDCIVAAEEGATMVRLGRALFGERPARP